MQKKSAWITSNITEQSCFDTGYLKYTSTYKISENDNFLTFKKLDTKEDTKTPESLLISFFKANIMAKQPPTH